MLKLSNNLTNLELSSDLVTWNDILGPMVMSEAGTDTITLSSSEYNEDNDNKSFFRSRFVPAESP